MQNLPFARPGQFFKGNLHTHSTRSDGDLPPAEVIARYRRHGYDFIALSDHFLARYDFPVTDTREYRDDGFTTLIAAELHTGRTLNDEIWHLLAVGLPLDFAPPSDYDDIVALAERAGDAGAFLGIVHPAWYGLQADDARLLPFAHAIEVYNHGSQVENDRGDGWSLCDVLLNEGRRVHAFATDDAHHLTHDAFGAWVHVKADRLDPDAIRDSLKAGHFYSSQGPLLHDLRIEGEEVAVVCSPASTVILSGRGSRSVQRMGVGLTEARLPLKRFADGYFRVTVVDDRDRKAWSNPVWMG